MNARLAALLTAAHAPAWRHRYGGEFHALLVELPAHPAVVADALGSAAGTHRRVLACAGGVAAALLLSLLARTAHAPASAPAVAIEAPVTQPPCTHAAPVRLSLPGGLRCGRLG